MELTKDELTFIHDILAQQQIPAGHKDFELFSQMMISILPKLRGQIEAGDKEKAKAA
jgi:hypothetical protein